MSGVLGVLASQKITAAGSLLLDGLSTAAVVAYSTRKLRTAYAGSAIKVRRSSDNTTQDIGFTGNDLDTTSLASFVGAGNGFIDTWYDQSGNGVDITQATNGQQPQIVASGSVYTKNSKAAVKLLRVNSSYLANSSTSISISELITVFTNLDTTVSGNSANYNGLWADQSGTQDLLNMNGSGATTWFATPGWGTYLKDGASNAGLAVTMDDTMQQHDIRRSSGTFSAKPLLGSDRLIAGRYWDGYHCETLIFASNLSSGDRSTVLASHQSYWGTP